MSKHKLVYNLGSKTNDFEERLRLSTFPTKKDTAEHYDYYVYIPQVMTWRVPRDSHRLEWLGILEELGVDLDRM